MYHEHTLADMVALPDFESGAMENWGLITYRERNLLYDNTTYTLADKKQVAIVIAHELAHQVTSIFNQHFVRDAVVWQYCNNGVVG
jgi:aminopeptidase N